MNVRACLAEEPQAPHLYSPSNTHTREPPGTPQPKPEAAAHAPLPLAAGCHMLDRTTWQPTPTRSPNTHTCFQHTNQAPRQSHRLVLVRGSVRTSDGASAVRACTKGLHINFSCFAHPRAFFGVGSHTQRYACRPSLPALEAGDRRERVPYTLIAAVSTCRCSQATRYVHHRTAVSTKRASHSMVS